MAVSTGFRSTFLSPKVPSDYRPTRGGLTRRNNQRVTSAGLFGKALAPTADKKAQLLELIDDVDRGNTATPEDQAKIDELATALEHQNPNPKPIVSPLLNGQWKLLYTTSESILGTNRPALFRPSGPIYQILDNKNLKARNRETTPFFNEVYADLTPVSDTRVNVDFKRFKLFGFLPLPAPSGNRNLWLDTTYLDEDLRISRGFRGNLFILCMDDRDVTP